MALKIQLDLSLRPWASSHATLSRQRLSQRAEGTSAGRGQQLTKEALPVLVVTLARSCFECLSDSSSMYSLSSFQPKSGLSISVWEA